VFGIALGVLVYRDMIAPLRRKLIESQSLVERNEKLASLGLLAAGVAHEIRTPLTAIKTAVFVQKKRVVPGSPEQVDMDLVEREISRLERIVTDFLQFARPAGPELTTVTAELPLIEARRFFAPQLARSNIQVILEPPLPLRIKVDLHQIHQVLINLLKNAAESIGSDGTITLRARKDSAYLSDRETSVVILEVEDTGVGITPEVEKRLFDPFFTTKETGTGLGLAIAARIVQNHGGIVQYRPGPNRGAIFGIVLPEAAR
jgi:signal transduction histidine kinase